MHTKYVFMENGRKLSFNYCQIPTLSVPLAMIKNHVRSKVSFEPGHAKMCLMLNANNKGADQPAHPRSLISAFVVRSLDSIMP